MKKFISILLFFLATLSSLLPSLALAAPATYQLLAPIGSLAGAVTLKEYIQGVFITAIGLAGMIAVIMIVICGIKLMGSGSVAGKSEAKQCIWNAIFGILIAVGSWLLLNTINPLLLKNDAELTVTTSTTVAPGAAPGAAGGPAAIIEPMPTNPVGWYYRYKDASGNVRNKGAYGTVDVCNSLQKAHVDAGGITIENGPDGKPGCFYITQAPPPPAASGEEETRNKICGNTSCVPNSQNPTNSDSNVYVNKKPCEPYTANFKLCARGTGTNVGGLPIATVNDIRSLASSCGCQIIITGGTEEGHSSHGSNIPVFDLSKTEKLSNFIKTNATIKANPSFSSVIKDPLSGDTKTGTQFSKWLYNGYWFTDETGGKNAQHWHVCKEGTVAPAGKPAGLYIKACTKR